MKNFSLLIFLGIILSATVLYPQGEIPKQNPRAIESCFREDGLVYFKFQIFMRSELQTLTRIISIDNVTGNDVYAFANEKEFNEFLKLGYKFEVLPLPYETATGITMADNIEEVRAWNVYPAYDQYITMMYNFATQYPSICRIVDAGNSVLGRKILFAVISKNVNNHEAEPKFMYTSTMHGDETTGYVLMLRLIDTLLSGYGTDQELTYLVDNMEIWINPLANPDGTYRSGNTITNPVRYNANNVDLNRNFPDPITGINPNTQVETTIFMNIATDNYFSMSANFHGGAEVVNYPWDHKYALTADNNWWVYISRQYADTVHKYATTANYTGTGTITTQTNSQYIDGSGTLFLSEMRTGNIIKTNEKANIGTVRSISSNTRLRLYSNAASNNTNISYNYSYNNTGYMDDVYGGSPYPGVTNGAAWYVISGGRQDYMIYFRRGREFTVEISATKLLPANQLPFHWHYNYRSFIDYITKILYGLTGIVTDALTNEPVYAQITLNIDSDNSEVYSDAITGKYNRLLYAGTYTVTVTAPDYQTKTFSNVVITNNNTTLLNIQLEPIVSPVKLASFSSIVSDRNVKLNWTTSSEENNSGFEVQKSGVSSKETGDWTKIGFVNGNGSKNSATNYLFEEKNLQTGKYKYRLKQIDYNGNYEYFELAGVVEVGVPAKFDLSQNYPNPFNPVTKINFDIPENGLISLKVYDILGKEVVTIVNETRDAGYYTIIFDASKLSSGAYFYRLSANGFSSVKKLVVLK
ncbi:MAG: carboxypeptidase regulatory-like domain-containing protein [Ignavibacteria bacterium]|nr:carboxypeptidase regulatory-like domain-containing protein [Ignavibacteria bacterium]